MILECRRPLSLRLPYPRITMESKGFCLKGMNWMTLEGHLQLLNSAAIPFFSVKGHTSPSVGAKSVLRGFTHVSPEYPESQPALLFNESLSLAADYDMLPTRSPNCRQLCCHAIIIFLYIRVSQIPLFQKEMQC